MADNIVFTNNASALLAASISAIDTVVQVAAGYGVNFPAPTTPEVFYATLEDNAGNIEVVKCTSRTGDNLTVVRAQDGTTAQAFTLTTTRVELRVNKIVLEEFLQKNGGTMTGSVDMNGNSLIDAVLSGASTQILAGEIVSVALRGDAGDSSNELVVPSGGGRATAGGAQILVQGDDLIAQLDVAGVITFDSATIGVIIPDNAYLRVEATANTSYMSLWHDGTDANFAFGGTAELNLPVLLNITAGGLRAQDLDITGPQFVDFSVKKQAVTAASTTAIDYTSGSYVTLTMAANIATLNLQNPPASHVGVFRLKVVQDVTGSRTITWPANIKWVGGVAPTLSTAGASIDFIDLWTDDGGTTWYGLAAQDYS